MGNVDPDPVNVVPPAAVPEVPVVPPAPKPEPDREIKSITVPAAPEQK